MLGTDVVVAFPMSTFIYANLISILNVLCVRVCVRVGVRMCEYYENSLYFAQLPWFLLTLCCCRYCRVAKVFFPLLLFIRPDK